MEEATRLFYVGMTRAKKQLKLITYGYRDGKKVEVSPFVTDVKNIVNPADSPDKNNVIIRREIGTGNIEKAKHVKKVNEVPYNPNAIREKEKLRAGLVVVHRVFGTGEITEVKEEFIQMKFPAKEKMLSIKACLEMGLLELV
jgi:DNA helicase-2/ATP-dependent DNA helicase PcrA